MWKEHLVRRGQDVSMKASPGIMKKAHVRLFRDDNLNSALSPQYVDTDILCMTFKREVNCGISNPEILNLNVLQERRQDRL